MGRETVRGMKGLLSTFSSDFCIFFFPILLPKEERAGNKSIDLLSFTGFTDVGMTRN